MHFTKIFASAVALYASVSTAMNATVVASNINVLTAKSQALQGPAQSVSIINAPLIIIGQGPFPKIIVGFTDIITTVTIYITAMKNDPTTYTVADGEIIFTAFRQFVLVHQVLLNILIGKAGLLEQIPLVGPPVAEVLRQLEAVVDTIAFDLINNVDGGSSKLQGQADSLHGTIEVAIKAYAGLSV
jgi:hypothetical protein